MPWNGFVHTRKVLKRVLFIIIAMKAYQVILFGKSKFFIKYISNRAHFYCNRVEFRKSIRKKRRDYNVLRISNFNISPAFIYKIFTPYNYDFVFQSFHSILFDFDILETFFVKSLKSIL